MKLLSRRILLFFSYQKYLCLDFYLLSSFATIAILLLLINGQAEHMYHNGIQVINGKCFNYELNIFWLIILFVFGDEKKTK